MIDEIPVRDPLPKKSSTSFSLGHLAILLGLVFVTLFILLLCSKGFDLVASKIGSQSKLSILSKGEGAVDHPPQQKPTIEIPISPTVPNQAAANPGKAQTPFPEISAAPLSQTTLPLPIPAASPVSPAVSESLAASPALTVRSGVEEEPSLAVISSPVSNPVSSPAMIENKKEDIQENKKTAAQTQSESIAIANVKIPGSHPALEKAIHSNQPNHFTVQIIAMHNPKKLRSFIDKNQLKSNVQIFQSEFQGKPWYVAVYGDFKTRAEALKALSTLPMGVKEQKPWVRSMASLQDLPHVGQ